MKFKTVSKGHPCDICGKPDWCTRSDDENYAICRRVLQNGGIRKTDQSGCDYYLYKKKGVKLEARNFKFKK